MECVTYAVTLSTSDTLSCVQVWAVSTHAAFSLTEVAEFDHEGEVIDLATEYKCLCCTD